MILIVILSALLATVTVTAFELFGGYNKHPIWAAVITLACTLIANSLIVFLMQPVLTYWTDAGLFFILDAFIAVCVGGVIYAISSDMGGGGAGYGGPGAFILFLVLCVVFGIGVLVTPPTLTWRGIICDDLNHDRLAQLMTIEDATQAYPDIDVNQLIRVAPATAMKKAITALPSEGNIGSYLHPHNYLLQKVAGKWVYIIDLEVTDLRGFNSKGGIIPGYIVVDAMDPEVPGLFKSGYSIKYAPGLGKFNLFAENDLDRFVYFNVTLPQGRHVEDLDSLEVDDNWNPYYTGLLTRPEVGNTGFVPDSFMILDPQTGKIEFKPIVRSTDGGKVKLDVSAIPDWVDRVLSLGLVSQYVDWWGQYIKHNDCPNEGNANQLKIDSKDDVVTSKGLSFQITTTSVGADQSLSSIIYIEPRTGEAMRYTLSGPTLEAVRATVEASTKGISGGVGYDPANCSLHTMLSRQTWYCIMLDKSSSNSTGTYVGVALVQPKNAQNQGQILFGKTLLEAYSKYRQQIATEQSDNPGLANSSKTIQIKGVVVRRAEVRYADTTDFIFLVSVTEKSDDIPSTLYFRVSGENATAAFVKEGDTVTISAYQIEKDSFTDVIDIVNETLNSQLAGSK